MKGKVIFQLLKFKKILYNFLRYKKQTESKKFILLSPAAASFDQYLNFEEEVRNLKIM